MTGLTAGADAPTQSGVAAHLPAVAEAIPISDLSADRFIRDSPQALGQLSGRGLFQGVGGRVQFALQALQDPPKHFQSLDQPARHLAFDQFPARLLPPAFLLPVALAEQQAPSLGCDPLNLPLELLALTALDALLFFGLSGHPYGCQSPAVAGHIAVQALDQFSRIALVVVDSLVRSEEHTSELQSPDHLVCRLLLEKKNKKKVKHTNITTIS